MAKLLTQLQQLIVHLELLVFFLGQLQLIDKLIEVALLDLFSLVALELHAHASLEQLVLAAQILQLFGLFNLSLHVVERLDAELDTLNVGLRIKQLSDKFI